MRRRSAVIPSWICAVIHAAGGVAPVSAQARDTAQAGAILALPAVEVTSSIVPLAGPAVTSNVPARITIMSRDPVVAWQPRLLGDALAPLAGVSVYDDLGSTWKTTLVTRGFTSSPVVGLPQGVSVFLDGIPVNEPDARQVNFDLLPLAHVQRIEVLSGTASLLGPNSLGGAVNLVTRRGAPRPEAELEVAAGSFGARSADAWYSSASRGWSWYAGGGHARERGWREMTRAEQDNGFVSVARMDSLRGLRLVGWGARAYAETAGSLPLSIYEVRPRVNLTAGDFEDLTQLHAALSGYAPVGGGRGAFNLYLRLHDAERFNVNQINDPDVRSHAENRTLGAAVDWRVARAVEHATVGLRAGASGSISSTDIRIFAERLDPGITTHVQSPIRDAAVFVMGDYLRGSVAASGGVRVDAVRIPFRNRLDPARDTTSLYVQLSPRGGVTWHAGEAATLYASVGRSFRAPAVIELACADPENPCPLPFALGDDPPLDPVTAVTWEAGGRWLRGRAALSGAAWLTSVRNDIFLFPYADDDEPAGSTIDGYFANIEATRRLGVELESRFRVRAHWAWMNYAWTRATFEVDDIELFSIREEHGGGENEVEEGNRLPLVPDHTVRAGLELRLPRAAELGVTGRYTGRRYLRGDEANEEDPLDGYFVFDARAGVSRAGWSAHVVVRNVLDTRYAAFGTFNLHQAAGDVLERFLTPGQPRSVRVAVRRSLGGER